MRLCTCHKFLQHIVISILFTFTVHSATFSSLNLVVPNKTLERGTSILNELKSNKTNYLFHLKNNNTQEKATCAYNISQCYNALGNINSALKYAQIAYTEAHRCKNDSIKLYAFFIKGVQYGKLGLKQKAITVFNKCLKDTSYINNQKLRHLFIGNLYTSKILFFYSPHTKTSYQQLLDYSVLAMTEYEKVLDICIDPGYFNVGKHFFLLKKYRQANFFIKKAILFAKSKHLPVHENAYTNLAKIQIVAAKPEVAIKYIDSSINRSSKKRNFSVLVENYHLLKQIYTTKKDKDSIIKYQTLLLQYKDSLTIRKNKQLLTSTQYMLGEKKNEIDAIQKRILFFSITGILIVAFYFFFKSYYIKKEKEKNYCKVLLMNLSKTQ